MELFGALGALAVLVVCAWIGLRLLLRRSGVASPEFLLGASLFLGGVLALPLSMAGADARVPDALRVGLGLGGQAASFLMTVLQAAFVWVVFRRDDAWAKSLVFAIGAGYLALFAAQAAGAGIAAYFLEQRGWLRWNLVVMQVMYAWASLEPLRYHARIRRQLRIGLGDRATADRVLLWGLANSCSLVSNGCIATATLLLGVNPLRSPAFIAWIGLLALGSAACLWLAFLAPPSWIARGNAPVEGTVR